MADTDKPTAKSREKIKAVIKTVEDLERVLKLEKSKYPDPGSKFWERKPIDNVWVKRHYPPQYYSLQEGIMLHREACCPEIFDNEKGVVEVNLKLCMKTKKKTKFTNFYSGTLLLPHNFKRNIPTPKILALSASNEEVDVAKAMGAHIAGGEDIILKLQREELVLSEEEIDLVVCTTDFLQQLLPVKDKLPQFPSKKLTSTGFDMQTMMNLHVNGIKYESTTSKREIYNPTVNRLPVPIGTLDMPIEQMEENWLCWKDTINGKRAAANLGPVILEARIKCYPSYESFKLDLQHTPTVQSHEEPSDEKDNDNDEDES